MFRIRISLLSALLSALFVTSAVAASKPTLVNGIAAIVNSEVVTYQEVQEIIQPRLDELRRELPEEKVQQSAVKLRQEVTEILVENELILFDYKTSGYNLPERVIEEEVQRRIREQFGDRKTLTKTLKAEGGTYAQYRRDIRESIIVAQMRQVNVSSELIISPNKIEEYYEEHKDDFKLEEQVKLSMIVINQPTGAPADRAQKLATEILLKLNDGADFAEMARVYSEGSQASEGGDWGWVERSVLREDLTPHAFTLKTGERSPVIVTPNACFLMQVDDKRPARLKPLVDVSGEIDKTLLAEERARLHKKYIEKLRKRQFIRYF